MRILISSITFAANEEDRYIRFAGRTYFFIPLVAVLLAFRECTTSERHFTGSVLEGFRRINRETDQDDVCVNIVDDTQTLHVRNRLSWMP